MATPSLTSSWARRIAKIERYYSSLGVNLPFKHHPKLEEYLKQSFDDKLVGLVCLPSYILTIPSLHMLMIDHTQMSAAASNQHSVHATYIQQDIFQYLWPSNTESLSLEVPASLPREEQGLASHIIAQFLIPHQHLNAFEKDPDGYVVSHPQIIWLTFPSAAPLLSFKQVIIQTGH